MARLSALVDNTTISFSGGALHGVGVPMRSGAGTPSNGTGIDGDLYHNLNNGDIHRRSSGAYAVVGNIRIDETLPIYRPAAYTGGAALSDANIASAIQAAYDAAASDHVLHGAQGAIVQIPRKADGSPWLMGTTGLDLHGVGYLQNIWLRGPACLQWSHGFTGECIRLRGSTPAPGVWGQGGLSDIHIDFDTDDLSTTAKALVLDAVVSAAFVNISAQNLGSGTGLYCRQFTVGGNSQNCTFVGTKVVGCGVSYDLQSLTTSVMLQTYSQSARTSDLKIDGCLSLAMLGGTIQSSGTARMCDFSGAGGSRLIMADWYTEGTAGTETLFYMPTPSITSNEFTIERYTIQSPLAKCFDAGTSVALNARDLNGVSQATTFLKARGTKVHVENCETPDTDAGIFDLDASALANGTFLHYGSARFGAGLHAASLRSDTFAEGSEPASPGAGQRVFNTRSKRPRMYDGAAWRDVGYYADGITLTDLLRPYAEAIFDPRVFTSRSIISGEVDTLTDIVNGAVLSAPSSIRRPTWTLADAKFGGEPSVTCVQASDKMLSGTLAHTISSASRVSFLGIAYATGAFPEAHPIRRRLFNTDESPGVLGGYGWDDDNGSGWTLTSSAGNAAVVSGLGDGNPRLWIGNDEFDGSLWTWRGSIDNSVGTNVPGGDPGGSLSVINTLHFGAFDTGSGHASNIAIGYFALLKTPLPTEVRKRAQALASAEFKLGI